MQKQVVTRFKGKAIKAKLPVKRIAKPHFDVSTANAIRRDLERASDPADVIEIEAKLDGIEEYMRASGLYSTDEIRPVNETKMLARWRLGQLLANVEREKGGRGKASVTLTGLGLNRQMVMQAQRIATLPRSDLEKAFAETREHDILNTYTDLIARAKPYWYKERRKQRHKAIQGKASKQKVDGNIGPFALIYADPPWIFETFTPKGKESHRMPDDHYPTMTDEKIKAFRVGGKYMDEIAGKDAALFLWATSSNIIRALAVMEAWGFTYKTHAIWDKEKIGLGLIFRNQHEVLLYGDRGKMPKPVVIPASVFRFKRTAHSRKPPEVRTMLEKMYPHFDAGTRAEFFTRGKFDGWSCFGNEATD